MKKRRPARRPVATGGLGTIGHGTIGGGGGGPAPRKGGGGKGRKKHAGVPRKATAGRKGVHHRKVAKHHGGKVRKLARPGAGGPWILGGNDVLDSCAAAAVANSLLAATGWRVSDGDVLALYFNTASGRDDGATIEATLETAAEMGLAGIRPKRVGLARLGVELPDYPLLPFGQRLGDWQHIDLDEVDDGAGGGVVHGLILGVTLPGGPHAVAMTPGGLIVTWGEAVPAAAWLPFADEAWVIEWD